MRDYNIIWLILERCLFKIFHLIKPIASFYFEKFMHKKTNLLKIQQVLLNKGIRKMLE
jgi:hypothetical protein